MPEIIVVNYFEWQISCMANKITYTYLASYSGEISIKALSQA